MLGCPKCGKPVKSSHGHGEYCPDPACKWGWEVEMDGSPLQPPVKREPMTAEQLAQRFHETYERLAPDFDYKTREASAKPWAEVPENNRSLMIAVCEEILEAAKK